VDFLATAKLRQGGHFDLPLILLRHFLRQGALHFDKWGHIAECNDIPQGTVLFLDCDRDALSLPSRKYIRWVVESLSQIPISSICYSTTQRGHHVIIRLAEKLKPIELVALQAILGSDSMREALNFMRARGIDSASEYWKTRWNILYDFKVTE
jgi:hypothetical protein